MVISNRPAPLRFSQWTGSLNEGPYVSSFLTTTKCEKWTQPLGRNPPVFVDVELYNTSTKVNLLRGNITILKNCKNKKINIKGLIWEQGKWQLAYLMNNMGCNSFLMPILAVAIGVKYDRKNCIFFKGKYSFVDLDVNTTQHLFFAVQDYGRIKWRHEFLSDAGSAFCWEFETLVVPLGTVKKTL